MQSSAISFEGLTKRFGNVTAVNELSFTVAPGRITGFLGPNGSGKTTSLRMLLGLITPTSGQATIGGRRYQDIPSPGTEVGAALEASSFHPGRTGLGHLQTIAPQVGATTARCKELLDLVGLGDAAKRRVSGYSMGMRQRLGLASALLGDPSILILDEPANGLDPQGIVWLRQLLRSLAAEGRTVLVSSHVLAEVRSTCDDVVVIGRGNLLHTSTLTDFEALAENSVLVRTPTPDRLRSLAGDEGWVFTEGPAGIQIDEVPSATIGAAAFQAGIELHQLTDVGADLERVFLKLTAVAELPAQDPSGHGVAPAGAPTTDVPATGPTQPGVMAPVPHTPTDSAPATPAPGPALTDPAAPADSAASGPAPSGPAPTAPDASPPNPWVAPEDAAANREEQDR